MATSEAQPPTVSEQTLPEWLIPTIVLGIIAVVIVVGTVIGIAVWLVRLKVEKGYVDEPE